MKKRTAVIDGDMIVYRAAFASEEEIKWDDDIWTLQSNEPEMKVIIDDMMEFIQDATQCEELTLVFSDSRNFRYDIFPEYKANRKGKRKPLGIKYITEWAFDKYNGIRWNNLEADDVVGMLCSNTKHNVAVSADKDFATLPECEWFNFLSRETSFMTQEEADYNHLAQALSGDSVDGFSGAKGIGGVTANKLLDKNGATWETVVNAYESKGQTEEDALMNARLSYILRNRNEYNQKEGEVRLWNPQTQK
jgi:DNA polymerase-1